MNRKIRKSQEQVLLALCGERRKGLRNRFTQQLQRGSKETLHLSTYFFLITIIFWFVINTTVNACDDFINEIAVEATQTLNKCTKEVPTFKMVTVGCSYASQTPNTLWQHVDERNCKPTKNQRDTLLDLDFALRDYKAAVSAHVPEKKQ